MAREIIRVGNFKGDHANADDMYDGGNKLNRMTLDLYSLQSQIISAGDARFSELATSELRIDAMLTACDTELKTIGAIPATMIPYDTTLVGAHTGVRRVREGGDYTVYDVQAYGTIGGLADPGPAFRAALACIAAAGGGVCKVPRATYRPTITSDADSFQLPSNCVLDCTSGPTFLWDDLISPLFVAVNKDNILIDGPTFEWNGTLAEVTDYFGAGNTSGRFGQSLTIGNRDFCAHVLSIGSSNVRVRGAACRTAGDAPTVATQGFINFTCFFPKDDVTRNSGNAVEECKIDDVLQGCLFIAQDNFRFTDITSRRFFGNHPVGGGSGVLGHLLYASYQVGSPIRSRGLVVSNIVDHGGSYGTITGRNDTSIQIKDTEGSIVSGITSKRPTGILSLSEFVRGSVSDILWQPPTIEANGMSSAVQPTLGLEDSTLRGITVVLPDNTDLGAFNFISMNRCFVEAYISASHTSFSVPSATLTTCSDNRVEIDYLARNATTQQAVNLGTTSLRNQIDIIPIGQNQKVRPFINSGCTDNVVRIRDNVIGGWTSLSHWGTEADSPAIGFEPIRKTKAYRIGTTTNPTTTLQLPRAGVWYGTVQIIESTGAHLLGGLYRITWDTGTLQSVELLGTQWTKGASAPTVLGLAVSNAGVVTVTSTAISAAWDIVYDWTSMGNNRYADY